MADFADFEQEESAIKEQLQGKILGVSLFPINFWALGEDTLWLNKLMEDNAIDGQNAEVIKREVFFTARISQDFLQREITESLMAILNLQGDYLLKTSQFQITNHLERPDAGSLLPYVESALSVNRKLDPSALSRGFLATIGIEYSIDLLLAGSVTIESCLILVKKDVIKQYLAFQITPLVKMMNPLTGEIADLEAMVKESPLNHQGFIEISDDVLNQKNKLMEILVSHVQQALTCYYPLLSSHYTKKL